ncbi:universal stress protein [Pusillimonas minor]|uniref:Universal stress protein n=1 Tax=Pusillimonas minor TaxID=2697024 RepID=A0A842HSW9_9BURK|nr:universal stress protein [Pusillimonas minor]MBC2769915.1 universal stress protein [Pusillimonas minor]
MNKVVACIDDSPRAAVVCDFAIWASRLLDVKLEFLHVLDRHPERASVSDYSGAIGIDSHESLLEQLSALDEERSKLAQEHGRQILQAARQRAESAGVSAVDTLQRHGALAETLLDLEPETRLVVMGQHEHAGVSRWYLDQNAERVVRSLQRPVMVVNGAYKAPERFVIAFDASATATKMVQMVAGSPLLKGLDCHLLVAGDPGASVRDSLALARETLESEGFAVTEAVRPGEAEQVIRDYVVECQADVLVMGAYGHSRIRHLIMGSTTSTLLRTSPVSMLVLR